MDKTQLHVEVIDDKGTLSVDLDWSKFEELQSMAVNLFSYLIDSVGKDLLLAFVEDGNLLSIERKGEEVHENN